MKFSLSALLGSGGMSEYERRKKALRQPRDHRGRWVGAGALVKWKSSANQHEGSKMLSGVVLAVKDGVAQVQVRNPDGSLSNEKHNLLPETLGVVHSKARLPINDTTPEYEDPENNASQWAKDNKELIDEAPDGLRVVQENGYQVEAANVQKKRPRDKDQTNPYIYQLYAPSGRSLGVYDGDAEDDLTDIIESDEELGDTGGSEEIPDIPGAPGDTPAPPPAPAPGPMVSSGAYSVPNAVREEIDELLLYSENNSLWDTGSRFVGNSQVTLEDVKWVNENFSQEDAPKTSTWASKILSNKPIRHYFDPTRYSYFAIADDKELAFNGMLAVDMNDGNVYEWKVDTFFGPVGHLDSYEVGYGEQIDHETATEVAYRLLEEKEFRPAEIFPHEYNMFKLADPMIDYDMLDTFSTYDSQSRAADAQSQPRSGGQFTEANYTGPTDEAPPAQPAQPTGDTTYFVVVDPDDETLILDAVAISRTNGKPVVFRRSEGSWVPDSEMQTKLESAVPPTVIELDSEEDIKLVLAQIDTYDGGGDPETVLASGYALPDGRAPITDVSSLQEAIEEFAYTEDLDVLKHIYRRAVALNAKELVPEDMRAYAILRTDTPLFGDHGEVVVVADGSSDSSPLESFRKYWLFGPHSDYIRWNTEGDTDRAVPYLTKFFGTERAEAFAVSLRGLSS